MAQRSSDLDLNGVVGHRAKAVRDHVEEVADGRLARARSSSSGGGARVAALHDDAVARARQAVARRAVDVVTLRPRTRTASSIGNGKAVRPRRDLPGIEQPVVLQLAARDGAGSSGRAERCQRKRARLRAGILRLIVHVLAAGREPSAIEDRGALCAIALGLVAQRSTPREPRAIRENGASSRCRTSDLALRCTGRSGCGWPARSAAR